MNPLARRAFSTITRWDKLRFHPEVEEALRSLKPIVALETAIVTHGMVYPTNQDVSLGLSKIIRDNGAVPATIALLDGVPTIGLTRDELNRLADPAYPAVKISRRDLAPAMALGRDGGTTVSGTMLLARQAGIDMFVTGGIGGVHRGGENTMDVSADLTELGRTPLGVVCAGCKSILDIGRTIEYLETQGVTVANLGQTDAFPAFYTPDSGYKSPWSVRTTAEAASIIHAGLSLPDPLATLITVPIPEQWEPAGQVIQQAVEQAVADLEQSGVRGKEATPWLLSRVSQLTQGSAVQSNIALIENNARKGAEIAVHVAKLKREAAFENKQYAFRTYSTVDRKPSIVVLGSAALDITTQSPHPYLHSETTLPGSVRLTPGGVALNIATCASRLSPRSEDVLLLAPVGNDPPGRILKSELRELGMRDDGLIAVDGKETTAVCSLLLDGQGGLEGGVADMKIVEKWTGEQAIDQIQTNEPKLVVFDGNLSAQTITSLLTHCLHSQTPTFFEPTSASKSLRVLPFFQTQTQTINRSTPGLAYISPNLLELKTLFHAALEMGLIQKDARPSVDAGSAGEEGWGEAVGDWVKTLGLKWAVDEHIIDMVVQLSPIFPCQILKLGSRGVLTFRLHPSPSSSPASSPSPNGLVYPLANSSSTRRLMYHPPLPVPSESIVSTTGAGDSLVGAIVAQIAACPPGLQDDLLWERFIEKGQRAAVASLQSPLAVGELDDRLSE